MQARGVTHHYRVAGADGVCCLAPPHWLTPASRLDVRRVLLGTSVGSGLAEQMRQLTDMFKARAKFTNHSDPETVV